MLIIFAVLVIAGIALEFLLHSFDPFAASLGIKALFLVSAFILIVSLSLLVLYAIAVAAHNGLKYSVAKYFGPEASYFKSAFRRSVLIGVLAMALVGLRRLGLFTQYFAGGAALLILVLELFYSAHDKHKIQS
jgi:hypothetical protein